jgi:hypothetical protein
MRILLAAGAAVALLASAGCDRTAAASTAAHAPSAPALPASMPTAPAGRWAYLQQVDGVFAYQDERCRTSDDTVQEIAMIGTPPARGCTRSYKKAGDGWAMHMVCGASPSGITVDTVITGDFATGYALEAIRSSGPGVRDFPSQTITLQAERVGDC